MPMGGVAVIRQGTLDISRAARPGDAFDPERAIGANSGMPAADGAFMLIDSALGAPAERPLTASVPTSVRRSRFSRSLRGNTARSWCPATAINSGYCSRAILKWSRHTKSHRRAPVVVSDTESICRA